jgi:raffinose/stachyose/melibiose transport system substrate-binding protein
LAKSIPLFLKGEEKMIVTSKSRWWAIAASLPITALVLAGCAVETTPEATTTMESSAPTEEPVTLVVQFEVPEDSPAARSWKAVADVFEDMYPNVTIELSGITNEAKGGPNLQVLTSNGAPDIGLIPLNSNVYTQMLRAGELVPLNDVFEADNFPDRLGPASAALLQADGNYYAAPNTAAYYNVVYTNPAVLKAAGVTIPANRVFESPAALIEAGKKCSAAGFAGLAFGGGTNYMSGWMFDAGLATAVPSEDFTNYISNWKSNVDITADYTAPGVEAVLDALESYANAGLYQSGYLAQDGPASEALFTTGGACMLLSGSWLPGGVFTTATESGEMSFEPSFAVLPPVNNVGAPSRLQPYYGNAYGIPMQSKNHAWAKKLLQYYISDAGQLLGQVEAAGVLPAVTTVDISASDSFSPLLKEIVAYVAEYGSNPGWTSEVPGALGQIYIVPLIQQLQEGRITSAEIGVLMQAELVKFRAEG